MVNQYNNQKNDPQHQKIVEQAIKELYPTEKVPHRESAAPPKEITIEKPKQVRGYNI